MSNDGVGFADEIIMRATLRHSLISHFSLLIAN